MQWYRCAFAQWQLMHESMGQYLTPEQANSLHEVGMAALHFYGAAAHEAASQNKMRMLLIPKAHIYEHILRDGVRELYNCRFFHNFGSEDFMKSLKSTCIACAGANMEIKVLKRSLLKIVTGKLQDVSGIK